MLDTIQKKENLAIHNYISAKLRHQYCNTFAGAVTDEMDVNVLPWPQHNVRNRLWIWSIACSLHSSVLEYMSLQETES